MRLHSLLGNSQQLDGGAMFGNVPKVLWSQWMVPDEQNRIQLACRCLLIQENGKNILLETGIGAAFDPKLKMRYGIIENEHVLLTSLAKLDMSHGDIDFVVLSHLHFDHAGGLLSAWEPDRSPHLLFPNARYLVSRMAWDRAIHPHPRDKASFIPSLPSLLEDSKRLEIVEEDTMMLGPKFSFHYSYGHTPGMLLTEVATDRGPLIFAADLIPGAAWVHLPVTMGYDRYPEKVIDEKTKLLQELQRKQGWIFFTHDPNIACGRITVSEEKKFLITQTLSTLVGALPPVLLLEE